MPAPGGLAGDCFGYVYCLWWFACALIAWMPWGVKFGTKVTPYTR